MLMEILHVFGVESDSCGTFGQPVRQTIPLFIIHPEKSYDIIKIKTSA